MVLRTLEAVPTKKQEVGKGLVISIACGYADLTLVEIHLVPDLNLRCMAHLVLLTLKKDPRVRVIKEKDVHWLASLLDSQYKVKVSKFILPTLREQRMRVFEETLKKVY